MTEILDGKITRGKTSQNAMGGTEILAHKLVEHVGPDFLKGVQIISSRVECDLSPNHIRIFWAHDLPGDPASEFLADKNEQNKFHILVFVSNWQMQNYINRYRIPWEKCVVLLNAIDPLPEPNKPPIEEKINLIYHSTPHRGLELLYPVVEKLATEYDNIHLDVFSSFKLYGWEQRDEPYKKLFEAIEAHPNMTNHGTVSNDEIRSYLTKAHIFGYPSIWQETSCLCLMEAMSAGVACIHNNYGALYETAANWTTMYQQQEDPKQQMSYLYSLIKQTINKWDSHSMQDVLTSQRNYANIYYSWSTRKREWESLITAMKMKHENNVGFPQEMFSYSS